MKLQRAAPGYYRTEDGHYAITNPSVRDWRGVPLENLPRGWSIIDALEYMDQRRKRHGKRLVRHRPSRYIVGTYKTLSEARKELGKLYEDQ